MMKSFSLTLSALALSAVAVSGATEAPSLTADFRDFGISRSDTVVSFDCNEAVADNRSPLFFADFRGGFDISLTARFNTSLTEQALISKEGRPGDKTGALTIGFDPGTEQVFAEVMQATGEPVRITAGPKVSDRGTYDVRVRASVDPILSGKEGNQVAVLELKVFPTGAPQDSVLEGNVSRISYAGDALVYLPGRWALGHGYPAGFPNSLQLRKADVGNLRISGRGLEHKPGTNPLFTDRFTADPAGLVADGRLYMYVGEDRAAPGGWFTMPHWVAYSTDDMINWTCHGPVLKAADFPDSNPNGAWAAQVVEKGGRYWFYVTLDDSRNGEHKIDVAVGDTPLGPFKRARKDATPLITDNMTASHRQNADIDPTVLIDDDGTAWIAWGNGDCYLAKLKDNMTELDGDIIHLGLRNYSEGPWLFKRDGIYYNVYAADAPGVQPEQLAWSYADSITGPWNYGGLLTGPARHGFTIHPSVNQYKGKWYLFYHDGMYHLEGTPGGDCRRHVCAEPLHFDEKGRILPVTLTHAGVTKEE